MNSLTETKTETEMYVERKTETKTEKHKLKKLTETETEFIKRKISVLKKFCVRSPIIVRRCLLSFAKGTLAFYDRYTTI